MVKEHRSSRYRILTVESDGERTLRIPVPRQETVTSAEIVRRRRIGAQVANIRDRMEPVPVDDLLTEDDEEESIIQNG